MNAKCFEGKKSSVEEMQNQLKHEVASWVSILPQFKRISIDIITHNCRKVASPSLMDESLQGCGVLPLVPSDLFLLCFLVVCLFWWLAFQYSPMYG